MPRRYDDLARSGDLQGRIDAALALLSPCRLCPRQCGVDRLAGEQGFCRTGRLARVASYGPHFGEERPLVGSGGSGTIFFSGCNLGCIYCQNHDISHAAAGTEVSPRDLAQMMVELQARGCDNINFVTPTHVVPQILEALPHAVKAGLHVPLVYNCGGYESIETLLLLEDVIDIYMPDAKYSDGAVAARCSDAPDYPDRMFEAIDEMHRQVGDLLIDAAGRAIRGLLVRHLVLPEGQAGTPDIMAFLAALSTHTYLNIMDQYRPCYRAHTVEALARPPTRQEYAEAVEAAHAAGLYRLDDRN